MRTAMRTAEQTTMRAEIRAEVLSIEPLDELERTFQREVIKWIDSGAELCRRQKPDIPPVHLISYFVLVDGDYILLVDHINAELWLPTGGHVEPDEHPRDTVTREASEELSIVGEFLQPAPIFVTITETVGKTAGHTDISLWYLLQGCRSEKLVYDATEFKSVRWFHRDQIPLNRTDKHMDRFLQKLYL